MGDFKRLYTESVGDLGYICYIPYIPNSPTRGPHSSIVREISPTVGELGIYIFIRRFLLVLAQLIKDLFGRQIEYAKLRFKYILGIIFKRKNSSPTNEGVFYNMLQYILYIHM